MKRSIKYVVLAFFTLVIVASVILMGHVGINYNISDYLDEETETKISLNIMGEEFDPVGNIQVMVEDITPAQAYEVYNVIKTAKNVLLVNFSTSDENYYKPNEDGVSGDALFAVIVEGDEYSTTAAESLEDIREGLDELFEGKTNYGGAVVEKIEMRNTMKKEIVVILVISVLLAMGIMLIMAKSWLEPAILLLSSGVAVLINMGTNAMFGEISYITNAVAAILQLALSIDYSIVLLHNFRDTKRELEDKHDAMRKAVKITFRPVLASAATTIAGLLALLFMTMKIGSDIGRVLTKGIVISALTSLVLLPALLLVFDKLMQKTSKRDLVIAGKQFCKVALKGGKAILLVAFALIMVCGGLQLKNTYSFVDSANPNEAIVNTFGSNNTVVIMYEHHDIETAWEKERELVEKLRAFAVADGSHPFVNITGYSNTVMEEYTIEMAAEKLNIPVSSVETLFALYHSRNNNPEEKPLSPLEFVEFAVEFLTPAEGEDYTYADENTVRMLQTLQAIHKIVSDKHTADELYELVSTGVMSNTGLSRFQIEQMYGLYLWDKYDHDAVDFETMLDFMVTMTQDEDAKTLMDEQTASDLVELAEGLEDFKEQMNTLVDQEAFLDFGHDKFGDAGWVDMACNTVFRLVKKDDDGKAKIVDILRLVGRVSSILGEKYSAMIENYTYVYDEISKECPYDEFLPRLQKVVLALTDEERPINATETAIQQAYIMYFNESGVVPDEEIFGFEFIQFVNEVMDENSTVAGNVSESSKAKLKDVMVVKEFICDSDKYNYKDMTRLLADLSRKVTSITASENALSEDNILTIYSLNVAQNQEDKRDPIIAYDLLKYVDENKNGALSGYMTQETRAKIEERKAAIEVAKQLFLAENYNRVLVSVNLDSETSNDDAKRFVEYLMKSVNEVFCQHAHVGGHIISTYELQQTFEEDNKIITVFTIISIFAIIMIVFGSFSLPVLLVAIIQGAIWITMSLSLISGTMFFMSYIIATCILMGSTIDYGILMSTNYLGYRKTMDKKEALAAAVKSAMPTIFTSGLILTICGFVVGFVASMTSISTVGFLLGKGTLVSVLVITLVLPSILYFLDGFIRYFTYSCGKERRRVRREKRKAKKDRKHAKKDAKKQKKADKKAARKAKRK